MLQLKHAAIVGLPWSLLSYFSFNTLCISYESLNPVGDYVFICMTSVSHTALYAQWK